MPLKGVNIKELAKKTEGFAGADIEAVCREAAIKVLRKDINAKKITSEDFDAVMKKVGPSITKEIDDAYESFKTKFKKQRGKEMKEAPSYLG